MAELTPQERLQPSLLDRLIDDKPDNSQESREHWVISPRRLREYVLRDLVWLLNTTHLAATDDLDDYPQVAHSVLNYGLPDLAGRSVSNMDLGSLERMLRQVILEFEPRILRHSLKIRVLLSEQEMSHNAVSFEIRGELWAQPVPLELYLRTELDLDNGDMRVADLNTGTRLS
ncbi:MAG: type VI secretion system baseplate subunit TssE [Candidatus Competibacteraceae bacterium]|nr:type VI secretion system baseplate subunit TssE [Candidatus Competibacteraceae bacterium]